MSRKHVPTEQTKAKVIGFSCAGFSQEQIADYLDIDKNTLQTHYRYELDHAKLERIDTLSGQAYRLAMNGSEKMIEFLLKTQGKHYYAKAPEDDKKSTTDTLIEKLIDRL